MNQQLSHISERENEESPTKEQIPRPNYKQQIVQRYQTYQDESSSLLIEFEESSNMIDKSELQIGSILKSDVRKLRMKLKSHKASLHKIIDLTMKLIDHTSKLSEST